MLSSPAKMAAVGTGICLLPRLDSSLWLPSHLASFITHISFPFSPFWTDQDPRIASVLVHDVPFWLQSSLCLLRFYPLHKIYFKCHSKCLLRWSILQVFVISPSCEHLWTLCAWGIQQTEPLHCLLCIGHSPGTGVAHGIPQFTLLSNRSSSFCWFFGDSVLGCSVHWNSCLWVLRFQ